ncbi:4-(cytidine 5'-diphospho)-2-C-methyl-D-erythritol kinase [Aurantiacibacter poecillastricola]|uniref:4-(cytidine 5'-diphospho)-2-C-methyl-D-erythritol kinase n=1 Tax=Aurantiacibacter poecillastricola TaxID=3064385 RepID=UPI00273E725B|nr:4-(cytidine 5'-diphospho)-2-C-methyl-D-erythritol kinase [Aurantiacibacter sp. 219JJ12-13]MDP5262177.1 4-(cytidine 5'-diphospho)-2-C-methyl-D-erythritol kinase [Aurantiacibacter sp. 219JJ12-13]
MRLSQTAYAKINLALHVRKAREDGYHELETLFAFVDAGDRLTARAAEQDRLTTVGEFATALDNPFDNIVMQALSALLRPDGLDVTLEKNLPVAAGLGGGSADAGAIFRMVREAYGLPDDWRERAAKLGADVPACVDSDMHIGLGAGEQRREVVNDMAGTPVLLVNPRKPVPTGPVFKAWDGKDRGPLPEGSAREIASNGRNDLRDPAIAVCPEIGEILAALGDTDPFMREMSGSGATCFALYETTKNRDRAAQTLAESNSGWWQMKGQLR